MRFWLLFASSPLSTHLQGQGFIYVTFLFAQKSNQKSALKNYVLKNLLNVPLQKSRGTCAKRNVTTFDMDRFFNLMCGLVRHCQHGFMVA